MGFDDLPDNQLDSVPLLVITQRVKALIGEHLPRWRMNNIDTEDDWHRAELIVKALS